MMTAQKRFEKFMGVCASCKQQINPDPRSLSEDYADLSYSQAIERFTQDLATFRINHPRLAMNIEAMEKICHNCMKQKEFKEQGRRRELKVESIRRSALQNDHVPHFAFDITFASSNREVEAMNPDAWKWARWWDYQQSVWIQGDKGVGKTCMARCMLYAAASQLLTPMEISGVKLDEYGRRFNADDLLNPYHRCGCLLVDDIDKCDWTERGLMQLIALIGYRREAQKPTFITANIDTKTLYARLKNVGNSNKTVVEAAFDRFAGWHKLHMQGKSARRMEIQQSLDTTPQP